MLVRNTGGLRGTRVELCHVSRANERAASGWSALFTRAAFAGRDKLAGYCCGRCIAAVETRDHALRILENLE